MVRDGALRLLAMRRWSVEQHMTITREHDVTAAVLAVEHTESLLR
jgi:hypothetical protein